nr:MAG TPA_asm: tail protein [Caudoviricetes sp.]
MNKLDTLNVEVLLPSSIAEDKNVKAIAKVVTEKLLQVNDDTKLILLWEQLPNFDDAKLSNLAWQLHVDLYDSSLSKAQRVQLIRNSILWHRYRGTKYAVESALQSVFNTGQVEEWQEYDGKPYHFRINGLIEALQDESRINKLVDLIVKSKNLRSWCDEIQFERETTGNIFIGGAVVDDTELTVSSSFEESFNFSKNVYLGVAVLEDTETTVYSAVNFKTVYSAVNFK